jgi:hypothetical protein
MECCTLVSRAPVACGLSCGLSSVQTCCRAVQCHLQHLRVAHRIPVCYVYWLLSQCVKRHGTAVGGGGVVCVCYLSCCKRPHYAGRCVECVRSQPACNAATAPAPVPRRRSGPRSQRLRKSAATALHTCGHVPTRQFGGGGAWGEWPGVCARPAATLLTCPLEQRSNRWREHVAAAPGSSLAHMST